MLTLPVGQSTARRLPRRAYLWIGVLAALVFLYLAPRAHASTTYTFTDLSAGVDAHGTAVTGDFARAINNDGDIAGSAYFGGVQHGSLWRDGVYYDLGLPSGWVRSFAVALNDNGMIVGSGDDGEQAQYPDTQGLIWRVSGNPPTVTSTLDIGSFGGSTACNSDCVSLATGVDNSGDVVGDSETSNFDFDPFLIPGGDSALTPGDAMRDDGNDYTVYGVNDSGTVVASEQGEQNQTLLLPGGSTLAFEPGDYHPINNSGWVIGYTFGTGGAMLSKGGSITNLPPIAADADGGTSRAYGINNLGDVVGTSVSSGGCESATLWPHTDYQAPVDLNSLVSPNFHMWEAYDINDSGQVVGGGTEGTSCSTSGVLLPYLLSPPTGLSGTVTDEKGEPVDGAKLVVTGTDSDGNPVKTSTTTATDGSYSIDLDAGTYDLDPTTATPTGEPSGGQWDATTCPGTATATGNCDFKLAPNQGAVAKLSYLLPDIQAENVEITQGIQETAWDSPSKFTVPGLGSVSGGTYTGVPLVKDVTTVVRVYASVVSDPNAQAQKNVTAVLHGYRGGAELAGSPISAAARTLNVGNSLPAARTVADGAFIFTLPKAWTEGGPITLAADINPEVSGERPIHECVNCTANNAYGLGTIAFKTTNPITIRPFEIDYSYPNASGHGSTLMRGPNFSSLFDPARDLLPLAPDGLVVQPFPVAVLDVTTKITKIIRDLRKTGEHLTKPDLSDCDADPTCENAVTGAELAAVRNSVTLTHSGHTYLVGFRPDGGGLTWPTLGISVIGESRAKRPLTSVAHEMLHLLGFLHASTACGGGTAGQTAAAWPPDELGYIEGIGLDRRPNSGGPGLYRIIAPGVGQPQWYDFMSYCTRGDDAVAWFSTVNWKKFVQDDSTAAATAADGTAATPPVSTAAATPPQASAATSGHMAVEASLAPGAQATVQGASATTAPITRSQPSTFHIKALNASGHVIANVGVAPQHLDESPVLMFPAVIPAKGAVTLELVSGKSVMAKLRRPSPLPSIRLTIPKHGLKAAHHKLALRWKEHGARGVTLTATIQYRASARQGWQTLVAGLTAHKYAVPITLFEHARKVHVRVIVNDGFSDATATSKLVRLPSR